MYQILNTKEWKYKILKNSSKIQENLQIHSNNFFAEVNTLDTEKNKMQKKLDKKELSVATNSNWLIPISLQPLKNFDVSEFFFLI